MKEKSIWKDPPVSHKSFVRLYKANKLSVYIHRSNALRSISQNYLPRKYFWIHTIWSWAWFLTIPAGIIMLFFNLYWGLAIFLLSFFLYKHVKRMAQRFVVEYALENEEFYKMMVEGAVLVIKETQ